MQRTRQPNAVSDVTVGAGPSRPAANRRRAALLAAAPAVAVLVVLGGGLAAGASPVVGVIAGLIGCVAVLAWCWWGSLGLALSGIGALPVGPDEQPRVHNLVEALCAATGLPKPDIYVVRHPAPDSLSLGRGPRRAALVLTTGLVEQLTPIELEGVLAHELCHVKAGDVVPSTIRVAALAPLQVLARSRPARSPLADERETLADMAAISVTRYPPGLIGALEKVRDARDHLPARRPVARAVAPVWLRPPGTDGALLDARIEALSEL